MKDSGRHSTRMQIKFILSVDHSSLPFPSLWVDWFCCDPGCLVYELCALAPPFEAPSQVKLDEKIRKGKYSPIPSHYSTDMSEVIR